MFWSSTTCAIPEDMDRIKLQDKSTKKKDHNVTVVTNLATERPNVGEIAMKITTETKIRLQEITLQWGIK